MQECVYKTPIGSETPASSRVVIGQPLSQGIVNDTIDHEERDYERVWRPGATTGTSTTLNGSFHKQFTEENTQQLLNAL